MVENLNDFFVNVAGKHSTDGVVDVAQKLCSKFVNNIHTLFLKPITINELSDLIRTLPNKYTQGPDGLPYKIIKQSLDQIVKPLQALINLSYEQGKFPKQLKRTRVTPIQKNESSFDINNFRPISINSVISIIYEKAAHKQFVAFLNDNNLLSNRQHGYRHGRSTATAVQSLLDIVNTKLQSKENTDFIFRPI